MPSSVCAQTTATSAIEPLVIHILRPSRTQSAPSRRARVRIPPGSEPWSGSVSPKQPMASPAAMRGQPLLLLLLAAAPPDGEHRQRPLHRHQRPDARSRRPPAPGRPARSRRPTCRRSRSPRGACPSRPSSPKLLDQRPRVVDPAPRSNQSATYGSSHLARRAGARRRGRPSRPGSAGRRCRPGHATSNGGRRVLWVLIDCSFGVCASWRTLGRCAHRGRWWGGVGERAAAPGDGVADLVAGGRRRRSTVGLEAQGRSASSSASPMSLTWPAGDARGVQPGSTQVAGRRPPGRCSRAATSSSRCSTRADWSTNRTSGAALVAVVGQTAWSAGQPRQPQRAAEPDELVVVAAGRRRSGRRRSAGSRTARWRGAGCPSGRG